MTTARYCDSCGNKLTPGDGYCDACAAPVPAGELAHSAGASGLSVAAGYHTEARQLQPQPEPSVAQMPSRETSGLAIAALVLALAGPTLVGMILGYVALSKIHGSGSTLGGEGIARAAIIIGWIWIAIVVLIVIALGSLASST